MVRSMWVSFIYTRSLGRMGNNMFKWLMIYLLNYMALCLCKCELFFKVIKRNYDIAAIINFGYWFDCHKQKIGPKV